MRKYNVNVNGTAYEVTVEEVKDGTITAVSVSKGAAVESGTLLCTIA